jgi:hypothetical protein
MRKIKKYQPGGSIKGNVPKGVKVDTSKVIKGMNKMMNPKKKDVDLSAPGKGMMEELKKKGSMPASQKNIGRKGIKVKKAKGGKEMIKRADGSYSQRGLWDNIRANRGSGKKPTAAMLKQERKIKAKGK